MGTEEAKAGSFEDEIRREAVKAERVISKFGVGFSDPTLLLRYTGVYLAARREEQWHAAAKQQQQEYLRSIGEAVKAQRQIHESVNAALSKVEKTQRLANKVGNSQIEGRFRVDQRLTQAKILLSGLVQDTRTRGSFEEEKRMYAGSRPMPPWWRREPITTLVTAQWHEFVSEDDPASRNNIYGLAWHWDLTRAEDKEDFWRDFRRKMKRIQASEGGVILIPFTPWGGAQRWCPSPDGGSRGKKNQDGNSR
jgi:hypothetical protein